jgi:N-methylhydantoinase B/oxoprolinase/acetone carboxylase alpha subunit
VEALERRTPLKVRRYRLRKGSGGAGLSPGGDGIERDLELLEDCTASLITERRQSRPWGLLGGEPGAPGENWLLPDGDESRARRLLDKCTVERAGVDAAQIGQIGSGSISASPRHTVTQTRHGVPACGHDGGCGD